MQKRGGYGNSIDLGLVLKYVRLGFRDLKCEVMLKRCRVNCDENKDYSVEDFSPRTRDY